MAQSVHKEQSIRPGGLSKVSNGISADGISTQGTRETLFTIEKNYISNTSSKIPDEIVKTDPLERRALDGEIFATLYFYTRNGLPLPKGQHYVQLNLYGPNFQFSLSNNLSAGIMTSWIGVPIVANVKQGFKLSEQNHFSVGILFGTGSWAVPDFNFALPFASISLGNNFRNISFSGGYGTISLNGEASSRMLLSIGGMMKIRPEIYFVFDSFLLPEKVDSRNSEVKRESGIAVFIPGFRWHTSKTNAFQVGLIGIVYDYKPVMPIPTLQWLRTM